MHARHGIRRLAGAILGGVLVSAAGSAQTTQRVSVSTSWAQGSFPSTSPSISGDGRFVAFQSDAPELVAGDTNACTDVFVRDRAQAATVRVSVGSGGVEGDGASREAAISADGRFVAFTSSAASLVPGDANLAADVFVRDLSSGTTERVSVDSGGAEASGESERPAISADGRFVAFASLAPDLVQGDANGTWDVFVRDRLTGTTERVSVDASGAEGNGESRDPSISADGRLVAFWSSATNLVAGDSNGRDDVFVRDREDGVTKRVSLESTGGQANDSSRSPRISADGSCVAFSSLASNLVTGDSNQAADVFVRDVPAGLTVRVSLSGVDSEANSHSFVGSISADGRIVAFESFATNLVEDDSNGESDVFVRDRADTRTERASIALGGAQALGPSNGPSISADGRLVAFASRAANLAAGDGNEIDDVFVRDRDTTVLASLCEPGSDGVRSCPCSNPPGASGRGCDNSSSTGGAALDASGAAELSADTLVFGTSGEKPTALSLLLQGDVLVLGGAVYGQGVRCVGGRLRRLFAKNASGGSITAPDFPAGDPPVSARSAGQGDPLVPGTTRWYAVVYRDPSVLGGCPATSRFDATQTRQATWAP
jgi:Tol biopolymer transport system component